jgi:NADPH-dependent 2,4-dienoyl-CoA reductase/sulfur reductase-like enzyme
MEIRINSEVIAIDPEKKQVTVKNEKGESYIESYDKLLLSPGATPVKPPLPGIDSEGIFTMRNVDDTDRIKAYVQSHPIRRAVVVGAGFIGLEMAENLHATGAQVAIVEMAEQVMAPLIFPWPAWYTSIFTKKRCPASEQPSKVLSPKRTGSRHSCRTL